MRNRLANPDNSRDPRKYKTYIAGVKDREYKTILLMTQTPFREFMHYCNKDIYIRNFDHKTWIYDRGTGDKYPVENTT